MERQVVSLPTSFHWRAFVATLACAVVCLARVARADEHPPIVLVLDPCADVDANEVRRLMPIEMGAPVATAAAETRDTTHVSVGCVVDSPLLVRLEVRDPATGKTLERVITLLGVARSDRGRLVAISAVELVAASRGGGREAAPPPVVAAPVAVAAPAIAVAPAPRTDVEASPRWRVLAVGSLRGFAGLPRLLPGGGLAIQRAVRGAVAIGGDVLVEGLAQPTALGAVDALVASASLVASLRAETRRVTWEAGLGVRGGFARLAGQAGAESLGSTVSARWGGPMAALRGSALLGRWFVLSLGGELGYATAGVAGHVVDAAGQPGKPDVSISGTWWAATLGVGFVR